MSETKSKQCQNPKRRACLKIALIIGVSVLIITLLSQFVTDQALDELKQSLSLWTVIATVIIINLVSFICFIILFSAYQWVKADLKPSNKDNDLDQA